MPRDEPQTIADVKVIDRAEFGWLCQIGNRCVFVDAHQVEPDTSVPDAGERGSLTIAAAWVADVEAAIRGAHARRR